MGSIRYAVLGPLASAAPNRAFLGCVVRDGVASPQEPIAVVWLPDELAYDQDALNQLRRQAEWVRALRHPHVVGVYGIESFDEGWARIVQMIDGEPLPVVASALRAQGQLEADVVVRIGLDAAAGLQHAHEFGEASNGQPIVHGGIRPETLLMGFDGRTRVSGFGASAFRPFRTLLEGRRATAFLAPEQLLGGADSASVRTDVYGLAAVLFELLTGAPPFWEEAELERAIMTKDLQLPPEVEGSEGLVATLQRGLHRQSPERYESMADFAAALVAAGPCDRETLVARLDELFPRQAFIRANRASLLESAVDPDTLAILEPSPSDEVSPPVGDASSPWSEAPAPEPPAAAPTAKELSAGLTGPIARSVDLAPEPDGPITHFDRKAGDGSRTALALVAALAFVCIGAVAWFGKGAPPEGLETPSARHELPPEILAGAFEAARPPPPPEATGPQRAVALDATPSVEIYRGDEKLGRTPLQVELRAGQHELRLTDAERMINVYRTIEVRPDGENVLLFRLKPAILEIKAPDGATVFLNDVAVGRAPVEPRTVYEGRYLLVVQHLGQSYRAPIAVKPGQRVEVAAEFD
ncbi:MAG: PEGA domain-containing protein [Myxococcota bacterium]